MNTTPTATAASTPAEIWARKLGRPQPDDECRDLAATAVLRLGLSGSGDSLDADLAVVEAAGFDVERRTAYGTAYAVAYPPGFSHTHVNGCVGVCSIPARYVVGSEVTVTTGLD